MDNELIHFAQGRGEESLEPCSAQEKEKKLLQRSNELPCCSTTVSSDDLFVPWELYEYIGFDLLRPLGKLQALKNMNLYLSIRNELQRRGKNGGLQMLDIAREISVPSYFREIRFLWTNYSDAEENDFGFAFIRIISFLHWANANTYSLTDLGPLNVEKLMLCYNCRWGETSTARKQFDSFMRQILFDMKDLVALRSWCGILREKTVFDVAMARAEHLTLLNLGTMVPKGPLKKWNLKELFSKLKNLEDFTWLNCDVRTLVYLTSISSLKRLVLHIIKYDQIFFEQFFSQFGFDIDPDLSESRNNEDVKQDKVQDLTHNDYNDLHSLSNLVASSSPTSCTHSAFTDLNQAEENGHQAWISVKPSTKKVCLEYAALSFAYSILQYEERDLRSCSSKSTGFQIPVKRCRPEKFRVPLAVLVANTVVLNLPPALYERNFLNMGISKKKFGIGLPKEICVNIKPNRTSYGSVVQVLEPSSYKAIGQGMVWCFNLEVEIHVMFDHYRKERVVHLFNLAMMKFIPKILRLHFTAAGRSMKKYYRWPHSMSDSTLFLRSLTVFELTLNCLTFSVPNLVSYSSTPELEEVYITLCGLPHNERGTIQNVMELFRFFMQPKDDLRIVIFRINAPYFFAFFEVLSLMTAESRPVHLETLGIVCSVSEGRVLPNISSRICNAIESVNPIFRKQLRKLILDGRVWGTLSAEHFSYIQNLLPNCSLEGELAPSDCKDLKNRSIYESDAAKNRNINDMYNTSDSESEGSESPVLDDGNEYLMRSDYCDSTEEKNEDRTFTEILASKVEKKDISRRKRRSTNRSQSSDAEETSSNIAKHSFRKRERIPLRKEGNESTDEEWCPRRTAKKHK
ncbi:unnamed protein product [Litomosoides sigmodontis]|uniref:Uncharacterized protein n=1 Tax=Litomosoides sigmodontis TaxID=42156 RepID=A0A3P6SG81_LITSI|nr:unnamed protein product [Litomosoides sigmodontis]